MIAAAGLDMIRRILLGIEEEPRYFGQRPNKRLIVKAERQQHSAGLQTILFCPRPHNGHIPGRYLADAGSVAFGFQREAVALLPACTEHGGTFAHLPSDDGQRHLSVSTDRRSVHVLRCIPDQDRQRPRLCASRDQVVSHYQKAFVFRYYRKVAHFSKLSINCITWTETHLQPN